MSALDNLLNDCDIGEFDIFVTDQDGDYHFRILPLRRNCMRKSWRLGIGVLYS